MRFTDLLTVGGKLYHETHFAPLLRMQGEISGIALELQGRRRRPAAGAGHLDGEDRRGRRAAADPHHGLRRPRPPRLRDGTAARPRRRGGAPTGARPIASGCQDARRPAAEPAARRRCPRCRAWRPPRYYHTASADQVGGDFYDLFPLADDRWGFFLGDVCGKGAAGRRRHLPGPLHPARRRRATTPTRSAVLTNLNTVLNQRVPAATTRATAPSSSASSRPRRRGGVARPPGQRRPSAGAAAARRRHRRLPAHPGRTARRHPARGPVHRRPHPPGPRRHPAALHRRPHRGPHRHPTASCYGDDALRAFAAAQPPTRAPALIDRPHRPAHRLRRRTRRRHRAARPRRARLAPHPATEDPR